MTKRILITGMGGFIGSHFLSHVLVNTDWEVIGIDSWNHKGVSERITESTHYQKNKDRVTVYTHDLNAPLSDILIHKIGRVDYVVNFASDSHVDRSIEDPVPFVKNNVNVALNMLEFARKSKPEKFIQISTDEVYGATDGKQTHEEWSPIIPSNPYSASKAAQEAIAISYWRTYSVPVIITNVMNTAGEYQSSEKYIPMVIKKIINKQKVDVHYDPKTGEPGSRFWLHARNTSDAVLFMLNNVEAKLYPEIDRPERFNIVGERQISNLEIAQIIAKTMGEKLDYLLVDAHSSRPGHDPHYGLCGKKLESYGYKFPVNLESSLEKMVKWTLDNPHWLE